MALMVLRAGLTLTRADIIAYARATIDLVLQVGRCEGRRGVLEVWMPALADKLSPVFGRNLGMTPLSRSALNRTEERQSSKGL